MDWSIGERIREIRESKWITQSFMSNKLGKNSSWLWRRESNKSEITAIELHKLLKALDITYEEFFLPYDLSKRENDIKINCNQPA